MINWGNKPDGIVDGWAEGFTIDGNGKDNVVNFRMYGNHTRAKIRKLKLLNSDFYAFSIGGLTSQGDKVDVIDGLDIDGVHIESERGNTALGTAYSFGLEIFPGTIIKDLKVRNVTTKGKIINKIHSVDGLNIDEINFKATSIFNSLSSGYCEINNCANALVGASATFDNGGNDTYLALLIGGSRVPSGQAVTNFTMSGKVIGRTAIEKFSDVRCTSEFKSSRAVLMYNECGKVVFNGSEMLTLLTELGKTGSIDKVVLNAVTMNGPFRFDEPAIQIKELVSNGGDFTLGISQIRLNNVVKAIINSPNILLRGAAPLAYAFSVRDGSCELNNAIMDGGGTWNRPVLILSGGSLRVKRSSFTNLITDNLLSSGSLAITQLLGCDVNNVAV